MPTSHRGGPGSMPGQSMWDLWWANWHWERFFSWYFGFHSIVTPLHGKTKKNFITGLHTKPQGCGVSVASAAGPFTKIRKP
jgi:hypothetical protein